MDSVTPPIIGAAASSSSLFRHRPFLLFWCSRTLTSGAYNMQAVAVGWQLYDLTNDPFDLGLVGLMQFFPVVVLAPVIGQTVDHFDRRAVAATCQVIKAICAAMFVLGTLQGWLGRDMILALILITGTARAFEAPTLHSIVPGNRPAGAAAARDRHVGNGATDGHYLRTCARRLPLCAGARDGVSRLYGCLYHGEHFHRLCPRQASRRAEQESESRDVVRWLCLHPQESDIVWCDLARPVRGAARRGDSAIADLCPRHSSDGSLGSRFAARGASRRRTRHVDLSGAACHRSTRGLVDVCNGLRLRVGIDDLCAVDYALALLCRTCRLRLFRCDQRGDQAVAGAVAHAARHVGPGHVGQFDVQRLVGNAR